MAEIQVLVDKSPLPPGFSPVCDPLDSSEARVGGGVGGRRGRSRPCGEDQEGSGGTTGARSLSLCRALHALGDDRAGCALGALF